MDSEIARNLPIFCSRELSKKKKQAILLESEEIGFIKMRNKKRELYTHQHF